MPMCNIMSSKVFTYSDSSELHILSAKTIIKFEVWEANRVRDDAHVEALEAAIKNPEEIQGPFSVVQFTDEGILTFRLIDGQHRQEVLRRHFALNESAPDFQVLIRRYYVKTRDEIITIFQRINLSKPMIYRGSSTERLHEMVKALTKEFMIDGPKGWIQLIRANCNRPSLSTEHLETAIKLYGLHETDLTPAELVTHALKMNEFYMGNTERLPGVKVTKNIMEKAHEYKFYLGLDPRCSWLNHSLQSPGQ